MKTKILKIMPKQKDRYKIFKKIILLNILLHYEFLEKEKDTQGVSNYFKLIFIPKIREYLKFNGITKKEQKVLTLFKDSEIAQYLQSQQIHFVFYILYLTKRSVDKGLLKRPLIDINKFKMTIASYKSRIKVFKETKSKQESEELDELIQHTEEVAKRIYEKHKYYLSLTDKDIH